MSPGLEGLASDDPRLAQALAWSREFAARNGRPLRVLHIGNIANNGYNDAELLVEAGIDCDVLCHDYYHIMGCPEWEDAEFDGDYGDQFHPAWHEVDLHGYRRPAWFAQGPLWLALRYLLARRTGDRARAARLDAWMRRFRWAYSVRGPVLGRLAGMLRLAARAGGWLIRLRSVLAFYLGPRTGSAPGRDALRYGPEGAPGSSDPLADFDRVFPDRADRLRSSDVALFRPSDPAWKELLAHYDVVKGYSTDPIIPYLLGVRPYVGYEHGTIRDIPFEPTPTGRLTALAYRMADHVLITNPDCIHAAGRLGLPSISFVPHSIDQKYYLHRDAPRADPPYVWCPSRHDFAVKGTDRLLRGFAAFAARNPRFRLKTAGWGVDIGRSRALMEELGIADRVDFVPPLPIPRLIETTRRATVLVDQFSGGFGGIAPTALACGTPLVMHLDFADYAWCFDGLPPYFEAAGPEAVATALEAAVAADPVEYRARALAWMRRNYWYGSLVAAHLEACARVLGEPLPGSGRPRPPEEESVRAN